MYTCTGRFSWFWLAASLSTLCFKSFPCALARYTPAFLSVRLLSFQTTFFPFPPFFLNAPCLHHGRGTAAAPSACVFWACNRFWILVARRRTPWQNEFVKLTQPAVVVISRLAQWLDEHRRSHYVSLSTAGCARTDASATSTAAGEQQRRRTHWPLKSARCRMCSGDFTERTIRKTQHGSRKRRL